MAKRQRDYAAERAARDAKYRALGYEGGYNQFDGLRRKGLATTSKPRQWFPNVGGRKIVRTNPSTSSQIGGQGVVKRALTSIGGNSQVKLSVVYNGRRYDLLSKGGWNAQLVRQRLYGVHGGDLAAFAADQLSSVLELQYGDTGTVEPEDLDEVQIVF